MATRLQVVSAEYLRELKNGQDFSLNTGDSSDHLLGHVGDRQQIKMTIQLSNTFTMGRYDIVGGNTIILKDGQNFLDEDFYAGGTAYLSQVASANLNWEFDILSISTDGSELVATNIVQKNDTGTPTGPTTFTDGSYNNSGTNDDVVRSLVQSEGLVCKFGFVSNTGTNSFISPLDGIEQAYKFSGIRTAAPSAVDGVWNSAVQGSNTGSMTCRFVQDVQDNGVIKNGVSGSTAKINSIQEFEIIQDFIIPEYLQGQFDNVVNQLPPEGFIDGLKQIFEFEFRLNLSNPNTSQFGEYNTVKGNVRYFNDNYISADQEYSISNVSLVDVGTGQTISSVNASSTTRVTCTVINPNNPFVDGDAILLEHSYLPNGDQYTGRTETYQEVWIRNTARSLMSAAPVGVTDGVINNFEATFVNAGQVDLQFDLIFTVAQQAQLQAGYNYLLAVNVADDTLAIEVSDTTKLVIQADQYTLNTDIAGLANFPQSYVYTRPMMFPIVDPLDRFTDAKAWIQDGILYDATMNLDLVEGAFLESLSAKIVAWNAIDNSFFVLDQYQFQLGNQVVVEGTPTVQQIEIDTTRGYLLADDDKLNKVAISTGTYAAPNQPYSIQIAFRCPWQEWVALPGADAVFYDPAEPNNGLNLKSSRYSLKQNYQIEIILDARISKEVDGESVVTQYIDRSATIEMYDFGEQDGSPITWSGAIQTFDESGADLGGKILTTANTVIKGSFTPDSPVTDASLYWCEIRLQKANDPGFGYFSTTSLQSNADSDPLSNPATLILSGPVLEAEATVDFSKLPEGTEWCPTVRFGLIDQSVPVVPTVKIQVDGNTRQVDGTFVEFQQTEVMANAQFIDNLFSLSEAAVIGTPPGWLFKVSPSNVQPNWSSLSYVDFASVASVIGAQSDRWVYVEADDTTKIDEGFIIEYEKPQVGQNQSSLLLTYPANTIDLDRTIYFDRKIIISDFGILGSSSDSYVQIISASPSIDDYTDLKRYTSASPITDLATINAAINSIGDGVKYGVRFAHRKNSINSGTQTFIFDYDSAEDTEKTLSVSQSDVNVKWRDFGNSLYFGPYTDSAPNTYCNTAVGDTALLNLLDPVAGAVSGWSLEFWLIPQHEFIRDANTRTSLLNPNVGGGTYVMLTALAREIQISFTDNSGGTEKAMRWPINFGNERIMHLVVTSPGDGDINNVTIVCNGLKCPPDEYVVLLDNPFNDTGVPTDGFYRSGLFQNRINKRSNWDRMRSIRIYDRELTTAEIRESFNDPSKTHSNLFRDWDFGAASGANVTENVAGQDMTLQGATPARVAFYDF